MTFDPFKTYIDLEPPKFDVGGNRITGQHDNDKTPDSGIEIHKIKPAAIEDLTDDAVEEIESDVFSELGGYFIMGVGMGIVIFMVCLLLIEWAKGY